MRWNVHFKVQPRRWKVGANSRQDAVLMLSSINLPGGVQVRGFANPRRAQSSLIARPVDSGEN